MANITSIPESITESWAIECIKKYLPPRPKDSHKNQFGHIVIVGGDVGMPGAILMAAKAALRVGAGVATVITNKLHTTHNLNILLEQPELMMHGVDSDFSALNAVLAKATVIILGPGLGTSNWSKKLFNFILEYIINNRENSRLKALVIDADGLNLLSESGNNILRLKNLQSKIILTPHPGEAKKLLHADLSETERLDSVKKIAHDYSAVVILKGAGSLICNSQKTAICNYGNPGMSSAGMGDVLSGIVAGLIAQGVEAYNACCLAVYLHAKAGDLQAQKYGQRGLLATDLLGEIRKLINGI